MTLALVVLAAWAGLLLVMLVVVALGGDSRANVLHEAPRPAARAVVGPRAPRRAAPGRAAPPEVVALAEAAAEVAALI